MGGRYLSTFLDRVNPTFFRSFTSVVLAGSRPRIAGYSTRNSSSLYSLQSSICHFFTAGFIAAIPVELEEASSIDGSTPLSTFWFIILPLLRPANATVAMFIALSIWNDLLLPLLFFNRTEQRTIMPGVYTVVGEFSTPYNELFSAALLASLPLFIFYLILQRQIIAGISAGGVKG